MELNPASWFATPLLRWSFAASFLLWAALELWYQQRGRHNRQRVMDHGSLLIGIWSVSLAIWLAGVVRALGHGHVGPLVQHLGLALMLSGLALRGWAVRTLGRHFTVYVALQEGHQLVRSGPYRWIRHPSYTGVLLSVAGLGLALGTWSGALLALIVAYGGFIYRIALEEQVLEQAFGAEFAAYKARTWKLFPGW
jgi:protein-S-isoprenylcysteine O-methyltransferase